MSNLSRQKIEDRFAEACKLHSQSSLSQAEQIYQGLLDKVSGSSLLHYNLGLLYFELKKFDKALPHLLTARKLAPDDPDVLFNYALCQKKAGQIHEAIAGFNQFVTTNPDDTDGLYNLGNCYREIKYYDQALRFYRQVLIKDPEHISANKNLAYVFHLTGNTDKALIYYNNTLRLEPDNVQAKHMISAINGDSITGSPSSYIREIFNNYSDTFDADLLDSLSYQVPKKLRSAIDTLDYPVKLFANCIDLGCGTGLAGVQFRSLCDHLTGIDLSEKMIAKAKAKNIYDDTCVSEVTAYLLARKNEYDLFLAADVVTYIGDLAPLFKAVTHAAKQQVLFCFSTENSDKKTFCLRPTGRFAHAIDYVRTTAGEHGWTPVGVIPTRLRKEGSDWVEGTLYFFTRK